MMNAVMDRWVRVVTAIGDDLARLEDPADHWHAVEIEAQLRRDPRGAEQHQHGCERHTDAIAASPKRRRQSASEERERERDRDAKCRRGVDPLRVEVRLRDDAGHEHDGAQQRRDERNGTERPRQRRPNDTEHRERDHRVREVQLDDDPAQPAAETVVADVVELIRGQTRIRHEDGEGDRRDEHPDRSQLAGHFPAR
jgi:hypothetical protein